MRFLQEFSHRTEDIEVSVLPMFLPDESSFKDSKFVWAYNVTIENCSNQPIQLLYRTWMIVSDMGDVNEVRGPGVIGEQPIIQPGEKYKYTSGTFLNTPTGMMVGEYEMRKYISGELIKIKIPAFSLDSPFSNQRPS